ncbi:MAG TPA: S53 family peptidase [Chloroflexia bacterium]|nr:S53 family peptidase [Chloroflexia bacterium]
MPNPFNRGFVFSPKIRPLTVLALITLLATLFITPLSSSSAAVAAGTGTPKAVPVLPKASQRVGPTSRSRHLEVAVGLNLVNEVALNQFLDDLYNPGSSQYKKYLTPQEFTARYVNQSDRAEVVSYLQSQGLTVQDSGLGTLVHAGGQVDQLEKAFGVQISDYKDSVTGRSFYSNDAPPVLPAKLNGRVKSVVGLSNYAQHLPRYRKVIPSNTTQPRTNGTPSGCSAAISTANTYSSFTPNQLQTAYNFSPFYSQGINGSGQTVAVYELDDYMDANVATYQACFGTSVPLKRVPVDGGPQGFGSGQTEVELDIEVVAGMTPGAKQILVYEAPNTNAGYIDEFQQIANDRLAQVVSISWGDCEPDLSTATLDTENAIFQQMAAQGQSVFAASGDYGSEGCLPTNGGKELAASDVLDNPYVTGVGGTNLTLNSNNTISSEITWNDYNNQGYGASGGGLSTYFARPAWQVGPGTNGSYANGKRMTPDVSAAASPYTAYVVFAGNNGSAGSWTSVGGTSAAAPLWTSAAAVSNNYLSNHHLPQIGFANPTLYRIFNSPTASQVYRDITSGDNCYDPGCGTPDSGSGIYPATAGYDMATGLGTLNAYNLAKNTIGCSTTATTVTTAADDGSAGSLRVAVAAANSATTYGCKLVDLTSPSLGSTINLSSARGGGLSVGSGVTLLGPACTASGPALTINGLGINDAGLTLHGSIVAGLQITKFGNRQIVASAGPNYLGCVKATS